MESAHPELTPRPFPTTPDTNSYYPSTTHERALFRLQKGLEDQESIMVLTGEPGTGKTLLSHCLLERLGDDRSCLVMTNSHVRDRAGFYQALLYDMGLPYEGRTEQEMRLAFTNQLLIHFQKGRSTIVLIDEAHHLETDLLEEIRLLGNLEARNGKAVQFVLLGQHALLETLRLPELKALSQRLAVCAELQPLDIQEAADYLLHHLRIVGRVFEHLFTGEAMELLAQATQGIPRLLNKSAQFAIDFARENGLAKVDAEVVLEVLGVLGLEVQEKDGDSHSPMIAPGELLTTAVPGDRTEREPSVLAFGSEDPPSQPLLAPRRPA